MGRHVPCFYFEQCGKRATHIWKPTEQKLCKLHAMAVLIATAQKESERERQSGLINRPTVQGKIARSPSRRDTGDDGQALTDGRSVPNEKGQP